MEKIVFLYKQASVPNEIIEAAKQKTPPDFELIFCEEKMSSKERREIVSEADYFMLAKWREIDRRLSSFNVVDPMSNQDPQK